MTKEEAIKNAYGKYWDEVKNQVDENGWVVYGNIKNEDLGIKDSEIEITDYNYNIDNEIWRPKSLQGIENNNGWINTNDELPTEFGFYHIEIPLNNQNLIAYYNLELKVFYNGDMPLIVTKWQPINYPTKSIY